MYVCEHTTMCAPHVCAFVCMGVCPDMGRVVEILVSRMEVSLGSLGRSCWSPLQALQ